MNLTAMQYKNYTWPHNPRVYTMTYRREMVEQKVPFGTYTLENLGLGHRVMEGEGEFSGKGAYEEFKKLANVFYSQGAGTLLHPNWSVTQAHFVALSLAQEPRPDYVRYSFTFWEDVGAAMGSLKELAPLPPPPSEGTVTAGGNQAEYHTVKRGETLWGIARSRGISLESILKLNGQLKNPNLIHVGEQVRVL